jgi:hypothetical protein
MTMRSNADKDGPQVAGYVARLLGKRNVEDLLMMRAVHQLFIFPRLRFIVEPQRRSDVRCRSLCPCRAGLGASLTRSIA